MSAAQGHLRTYKHRRQSKHVRKSSQVSNCTQVRLTISIFLVLSTSFPSFLLRYKLTCLLNSTVGGLCRYTGTAYRFGCSYRYTRLSPESTSESAEIPRRESTTHPDSREIEYSPVPNTEGKSDLWKHFNVCERQTAKLVLMLLYVNSAIPLSNLRETPQTCQGI